MRKLPQSKRASLLPIIWGAPATSKADAKGKYFYDHTQQTVVGDQKNLTYYARFIGGSDVFKFNMKDDDWNAKERKQWAIPKTYSYKTVSN